MISRKFDLRSYFFNVKEEVDCCENIWSFSSESKQCKIKSYQDLVQLQRQREKYIFNQKKNKTLHEVVNKLWSDPMNFLSEDFEAPYIVVDRFYNEDLFLILYQVILIV